MQVFETPGSVSLQIRLPSGRVVVTTADEPRTSVELVADSAVVAPTPSRTSQVTRTTSAAAATSSPIEEKDRIRWGPLRITWGADVEVRVTCPPGADLDLSGGSTDLRVEGELGEVTVRTASGDVQLESVRRKLQVKTASGDVSVGVIEAERHRRHGLRRHRRRVASTARSSLARSPATPASRRCAGRCTLATTSGDVEARVGRGGGGPLPVRVSGDVRIGVGRGTRVWIDATSVSGRPRVRARARGSRSPRTRSRPSPSCAGRRRPARTSRPSAATSRSCARRRRRLDLAAARTARRPRPRAHRRAGRRVAPVVAGKTERRGQDLVEAGLVEAGLARRGDDARDRAPAASSPSNCHAG